MVPVPICFQVFVANPNKPPAIANILRKNKEKLLVYLKEFHKDRDDELFNVRQHKRSMPPSEKLILWIIWQ